MYFRHLPFTAYGNPRPTLEPGSRHEDPPMGEKGGVSLVLEITGLVSRGVDRSGPQAY